MPTCLRPTTTRSWPRAPRTRAAAHRRLRDSPAGSLDDETRARSSTPPWPTLAHMGHRLDEADAPFAALMAPFETIVLGQSAALRQNVPPERFEQLEAPTRDDGGRRRAHRRRRLRARGGRRAAGDGRRARGDGAVRAGRLARAHAGGARRSMRSPSTPAAPSAGAPTFEWHSYTVAFNVTGQPALSLPCGSHGRRACRSACRSPGRRAPTRSCSRSAPPSSGRWPDAMDAADLGVVEAAALIAERRLSASELDARLPRAHPRARRDAQPRGRSGVRQRLGARLRGGGARGRGAGRRRARARRREPLPQLCGIPIGLKDLYGVAGEPLTASSSLLDERPLADCDVWAGCAPRA